LDWGGHGAQPILACGEAVREHSCDRTIAFYSNGTVVAFFGV
jgi:hypothetical protein